MAARDPRQQVEVVVNDHIRYRYAGDVDHFRARHAQEHEEAEHAFFVVEGALDLGQDLLVQRKGGYDHDRAGSQFIREDFFELAVHQQLELVEGRSFLFGSRGGKGLVGGKGASGECGGAHAKTLLEVRANNPDKARGGEISGRKNQGRSQEENHLIFPGHLVQKTTRVFGQF